MSVVRVTLSWNDDLSKLLRYKTAHANIITIDTTPQATKGRDNEVFWILSFQEFFLQKTSALYKAVRIFWKLHILPINCGFFFVKRKGNFAGIKNVWRWVCWWCKNFKWKLFNWVGTLHLVEIHYDRNMMNLTFYNYLVCSKVLCVQKMPPQFCQNPLRD